jgi:hypothetical protein
MVLPKGEHMLTNFNPLQIYSETELVQLLGISKMTLRRMTDPPPGLNSVLNATATALTI